MGRIHKLIAATLCLLCFKSFTVDKCVAEAQDIELEAESVDVEKLYENDYDPMKSRIAPKAVPARQVASQSYYISPQRLEQIRAELLYPYFDTDQFRGSGDLQTNINSNNAQLHKNLGFLLPFFGFGFNYTIISLHGHLSFSDGMDYFPAPPLKFPNINWPKENDPSFIAPFYSRCKIGTIGEGESDLKESGVYFRLERDLPGRMDQFGVELRERLKWDIREAMIGAESFIPKHTIIATWKNVTFAGGLPQAIKTTNTFQAVITTDEVRTFAMFNYGYMGWTTHTEAGGDTLTGQGGVPAFVGFNAGNGTRAFQYIPYSQDMRIRDLPWKGWANDKPGRHVFRIDEKVYSGNCFDDESVYKSAPLIFAPESANMMGGILVNVTGPCFTPDKRIMCRFDTQEVVGRYVGPNRAVCVMPRVYAAGYIDLAISIDGGQYAWKGRFYVDASSDGCAYYRFERRASQDCVGYQPPGAAAVFGDPHFFTFDNLTYTFNGKGEYVLVRSDDERHKIDIQGRFEAVEENMYGSARATVLTAVAAKENSSVPVEVRIRQPYAQWRYRLDVIVDYQPVYFDSHNRRVQNFKGVTVYTPANILNQSHVIIMFSSGAGVEIVENQRHMSARVYLPITFVNHTRGLFGNWSFEHNDDLMLPDASFSVMTDVNNLELLHDNFGMLWNVDDKYHPDKGRSLFFHENDRSSNFYYDATFRPVFFSKPPLPINITSFNSTDIEQTCGTSYQCYYDYAVTLNRQYGTYAKYYFDDIVNIRSKNLRTVISCGNLPVPQNGRKSSFEFTVGTIVKIDCDPGYVLVGEDRRYCWPNGEWSWTSFGAAECVPEGYYYSNQAGIIAGIILAVIVPMCLICGWFICCVRKENNKRSLKLNDRKSKISRATAPTLTRETRKNSISSSDSAIL
ncbi:hypothetical protein QYM36_004442 [Artemia franciscana]|uniref:Sushi domain-containing protein n=1 Tax=Artemia franciscana TaxID=6661 RepID=A0AA88I0C6_ARTSF|nr:hypothetical protein QYM36_004442 [Artemia franciscana]